MRPYRISFKYQFLLMILLFCNVSFAQSVASRNLSMNIEADAILYHQDGSIYAAGGWNAPHIYKIHTNDSVSIFATGLTGIVDMVWGTNDTIIGSSYQQGRLLKIAPDGTWSNWVQSSVGIASLYKDINGDIIGTINPGLNHPSSGSVIKVSPNGQISAFASGGTIYKPGGITQDSAGNYYTVSYTHLTLPTKRIV